MKDPIKKVKEILTVLIADYLKEFLFRMPNRSVKDTEPMDSEKDFYAALQEKMKEFRTFHDQIILANIIDSADKLLVK